MPLAQSRHPGEIAAFQLPREVAVLGWEYSTSPGWFQRLHDVRLDQLSIIFAANLVPKSQQLKDHLYISTSLKTEPAASFLRATASVDVISNAITALVAP